MTEIAGMQVSVTSNSGVYVMMYDKDGYGVDVYGTANYPTDKDLIDNAPKALELINAEHSYT